jgi:putative phosphotransacetylase
MDESELRRIIELAIIRQLAVTGYGYYVPVAISGRHVHLCAAHVEALFGKGYVLKKSKYLLQPDQYACEETVTLKCTKDSLTLRVLGPVRKETQAEISITDAYKLGIEPVVRMSGNTENTPGGLLTGPAGEIKLDRGVVIAARHIHMSDEEAVWFGLKNGDTVSIKKSGVREIIFGNTAVRTGAGHSLEMHIDTDEANAAGINGREILELLKTGETKLNQKNKETVNPSSCASMEPMDLITEWDVKVALKEGVRMMRLSQKGIITPLVRDTAKELGITIEINRG